jgi:pyruvate,water dikinase
MLPGAVTPLSLTTSVRGIDSGLVKMLIRAGAYTKRSLPEKSCIVSFSNHLFFNLTTLYKLGAKVLGADSGAVEASVCGRRLENIPDSPWKKACSLVRLKNGISYFRYLLGRKKALKKVNKIIAKINLKYNGEDLVSYYNRINKQLPLMFEATCMHYITSAHSGAMSSAFLQILQSEGKTDEEVRGILAGLLEDIENIESVDILRSMRRIGRAVLAVEPKAAKWDSRRLLEFLESSTGEVKGAYNSFLYRHGHRAIREAEMRSKSWAADKIGLMESLTTVIASGATEPQKSESRLTQNIEAVLSGRKKMARKGIGFLIKSAREGVYNREYTKSKFIKAVDIFKNAYSVLAAEMEKIGALPDTDLIYFLTHQEIGLLLKDKKVGLIKKALQRRRLLDEQEELSFSSVYVGKPKPVKKETARVTAGMVLMGMPVSRGEKEGFARVVNNIDDAKKLKKGEIMVAAFTDIGWSPYYSVIGGLVTEVGSALSHGAVVAREYALPLVTNVANATKRINTGDKIRIDGGEGTVVVM